MTPRADCATAPDCVQYAPFTHKVLLWDMFPQYQASAPLRQNEWNHVKVVISGRRMHLFVNGATSPTLAVGSLEGDAQEGQLALIGPGAFANLTVTPDAVDGLAAQAEADPLTASAYTRTRTSTSRRLHERRRMAGSRSRTDRLPFR